MSVILRKMTLDDVEQVVAIDKISFSLPWPTSSFHFVAAMLVAWFIVDEIHIATIATHPDFRKQGIGEKLLSFTLQSAKDEGVVSSFLEVRESNEAALMMYRKFGYVESGRRAGYYKDNGEDAILMTLESLNIEV
jgi:ribosomal-protein-alanine N-acetyltransferase